MKNNDPSHSHRRRPTVTVALGLTVLAAGAGSGLLAGAADAHSQARHRSHSQHLVGSLHAAHVRIVTVKAKGGRGGGGDPGDDYPAQWRNVPQDSVLDQWREYNRECTSFAAWALYSRDGYNMPFNANANNWGPKAAALGIAVNSTPAAGSIAWSNAGSFGHVAYVVSVSGVNVNIEEYNEHGNGLYDARTVASSAFTGYIHFHDQAAQPAPASPPGGPIQGSSAPIQGSTTPVQGSTTPVQGSAPIPPPAARQYAETTGGLVHTWTDYANAGGAEGPSIPSNATVQIACKIGGFAVADGDTWWYRLAASPWNGAYYASADAFYNDGQTSGSLHGTPFDDPNVPNC
jgi:surface antigen